MRPTSEPSRVGPRLLTSRAAPSYAGAQAVRGYARSGLGQVHYRQEGEGGPAIVFFHEAPLSSAIYIPALPLLGRSFRAWAFDTPGHGFSDPPERPLTIEEYGTAML